MKTKVMRMVVMLSFILTLMTPIKVLASDLSGHWAEGVMNSWVEKGFLSPYEDGTIRPDSYVMRAEFVDMINLVLGFSETSGVVFEDVPKNAWFHEAVDIAVTAGYANGVTETTFLPSANLTREQAATFVYHAIGIAPEMATKFVDHDAISPWAVPAVGAMSAIGYLSGNANGEFAPKSLLTRAEAVSFLERVRIGVESSMVQRREVVTLSESGTILESTTVSGDLHITMADDLDEIFVDDVVVLGNVYINGTGSGTVFANNMIVYGDIFMEQTGVNFEITGNTQLSSIEITKSCRIQAKELTGAVKKVVFNTEISKSYRTTLGLNLETIVLNAPTSVVIERMVENLEVTERATGSIVNFSNQADVAYLEVNAMMTLSGAGTVGTLQANCIGITVGRDISAHTVETAVGVGAPVVSIIDTILHEQQEEVEAEAEVEVL
ncbi:MAG: S-layer homology domain-containing protein [Bacillota bacterium]